MAEDWSRLTVLLNRLGTRDTQERVYQMVYAELRDIAHRLVSHEPAENAYQATELLHETYVKKLRRLRVPIRNRQHFYSLATRAMRQVLIEEARRRKAEKRLGPAPAPALAEWLTAGAGYHDPGRMLELEPVLERLRAMDPRAASVVDLRYFLGCSLEETAEVLGASVRNVRDDWDFARAWLLKQIAR
jgi:RNA polymerase sigma factor (TIGR02999 family)